MVRFIWMPREIWFYVIIPIIFVLLVYFLFWMFYRKKRGSYYYNYVVDYVYSTLGIVFCSLLFCLLLGYSIATIKIIFEAGFLSKYFYLTILLVILPIVPSCFLVYIIRIYLKNLKRKEKLDLALETKDENIVGNDFNVEKQDKVEIPSTNSFNDVNQNKFEESEFELKKKN